MEDFDYLNGTLEEWDAKFLAPQGLPDTPEQAHTEALRFIAAEYLPRFEAALHRNTTAKRGW